VNIVVPLLVFVTLGVGSIFALARGVHPDERPQLVRILLIAFALRVTMSMLFELIPEFRLFHEDANGYELIGIRVSQAWTGRAPPYPLPEKNWGYFAFSAALAVAFGPFPVNPAMCNAVIGTLTALLIYQLARRLFHRSIALMSAALVSFAPSMIMWSSIALKDAMATFFITIALSSCVSLKERISLRAVAGIVLALAALQPLRFYIVYFVVFAVVVSLAIDRRDGMVGRLYKQLVVGGAVVGLFVMLGLAGKAVEGTEQFDLRFANSYRQGMAISAHTGYGQDVDISTPGGALGFLPVGVATLLLAPFPWQMTSFRTLIAAPEAVAWWCLFPATIRGIVFVVRRKFGATSPLLLFMIALTCVYGISQGNVGSAYRQRAQIFVFLFIFTAVGWYVKKCRRLGIDEGILLRGENE
jgi:4-amino-4-deoxy-L-arabinose transferase-like glycosyltransferase